MFKNSRIDTGKMEGAGCPESTGPQKMRGQKGSKDQEPSNWAGLLNRASLQSLGKVAISSKAQFFSKRSQSIQRTRKQCPFRGTKINPETVPEEMQASDVLDNVYVYVPEMDNGDGHTPM